MPPKVEFEGEGVEGTRQRYGLFENWALAGRARAEVVAPSCRIDEYAQVCLDLGVVHEACDHDLDQDLREEALVDLTFVEVYRTWVIHSLEFRHRNAFVLLQVKN
jgi:hypothetical protein